MIPDNINSKESKNCSTWAEVTEISKLSEYQQLLQRYVHVLGGYSLRFANDFFTTSQEYQKIKAELSSKGYRVLMSSSNCSYYTLSSNETFRKNFDSKFVSSVQSAARSGNWVTFIEKYGTHYPIELKYGGRYTRSFVLSSAALEKVHREGVKLIVQHDHLNAPASLASKSNDKFPNSLLSKIAFHQKEIFLGGISDKNQTKWKVSVSSNSVPIEIILKEVSDLFSKVPGINANKAVSQFQEALKKYDDKITNKK